MSVICKCGHPEARHKDDRGPCSVCLCQHYRAETPAKFGDLPFAVAAPRAVLECARRFPEFTTDPVWALLGKRAEDGRALGPIILAALTEGLISKTGRHQNSTRGECHGRPVAIWRSNIFTSAKPKKEDHGDGRE